MRGVVWCLCVIVTSSLPYWRYGWLHASGLSAWLACSNYPMFDVSVETEPNKYFVTSVSRWLIVTTVNFDLPSIISLFFFLWSTTSPPSYCISDNLNDRIQLHSFWCAGPNLERSSSPPPKSTRCYWYVWIIPPVQTSCDQLCPCDWLLDIFYIFSTAVIIMKTPTTTTTVRRSAAAIMLVFMLGSCSRKFTQRSAKQVLAFSSSSHSRRCFARSVSSGLNVAATEESAAPSEAASASEGDKKQPLPDMEEIVSLCKRRGIIFPSSEIYNGYAGFFDFGPLGAELKKNLKDAWWQHFVTQREDVVGLDSSIIHNPTTWKSSGKLWQDRDYIEEEGGKTGGPSHCLIRWSWVDPKRLPLPRSSMSKRSISGS